MKIAASIADLTEGNELSEEEFRQNVLEISDEHAFHIWLADEHPFEGGARRFLDHIEECAKASLLPPGATCLPNEEVEALKFSLEQLRPCFDQLAKLFINPLRETRPHQCDYGYEKLWGLIGAAFQIGVHGTVTEGAKNFFTPGILRKASVEQAKMAAGEKQKRAADRHALLDPAIKEEMEALRHQFAPAKSEKYAARLQPGVLKRLNGRINAPSVSAIKARVKVIIEGKI